MKKQLLFKSILFLGLTVFLANGCTKDGATGPQGPQGPIGNANVTSTTYSIPSWLYTSPYYYTNLNVSALTSDNLNSSAVVVYFSTGSNWIALPYTQYNSPADYYMGFNTGVGYVQITWVYDSSTSAGSDPNSYYSASVNYKVVVIPPAMRKPNVNPRNYSEVKAAYHLKD